MSGGESARRRFATVAGIGAAAWAAMLGATTPAHAFHTILVFPNWQTQVFCDMPTLTGEFHRDHSRYVAKGSCVELGADQPQADGAKNRSEFPLFNRSTELSRAGWTAQGNYDPATREAWEVITLLPPAQVERSPHRQNGRFESRMICAADPWLETSARCLSINVTATGDLASLEPILRAGKRPFTSTEKEPVRNVLIEQRAQTLRRLDLDLTTATARSGRAAAILAANPAVATPAPAPAKATANNRSSTLDWGKAAPSALGSR